MHESHEDHVSTSVVGILNKAKSPDESKAVKELQKQLYLSVGQVLF